MAALTIPALVGLAIWFSGIQERQRETVERTALETAQQIVQASDAEVRDDLRLLQLLATSWSTHRPDIISAVLVDEPAGDFPNWRAIVFRASKSGAILFERGKNDSNGALRPLPSGIPDGGLVEGAFADGRYCPCAILHQRLKGSDTIVSLYLSPNLFQQMLLDRIEPGTVAGLVDSKSRFLARSVDYEGRVGTPATVYVRRAVAKGGSGIYEGVTYENLVNYSAYWTSDLTGWSAHVAVDRSSLDGPRYRANISILAAILLALGLALMLALQAAQDAEMRRRQQEKLLTMQKAEALGQFTGTVVHDFRNLLAAVEAGLRLIRQSTSTKEAVERTELVEKALDRGKRLVNQLLSFARGETAQIGSFDIRPMMEDIAELVHRSLGEGIDFEWSVDDDARWIVANRDQLELAIINLAMNARDAMNGKGSFAIRTRRDSNAIEISASDTGPGVAEALREEIFDPYFTTKTSGKGTGLGLAQVAGTVTQAGGSVTVREKPDGGAQFVLSFPVPAKSA